MEKKTILDQIEITRSGVVQFRFALAVLDGDQEIACNWHRTTLEPGVPLDSQMSPVNGHIQKMGYPAIAEADLAKAQGHVQLAHTPEVVAAYAAQRAPASYPVIMFAEESLTEELISQISLLAPEHWAEVAVNKTERPLDIDWNRYRALAKTGAMRFFIMRADGKLAGYAFYAILDHIRYKGWKYAYADVCYIALAHRKTRREAYRNYWQLQSEAEEWAKGIGCREILAVSKNHRPLAPLLTKMGYRATETIYSRLL